MGADRQKKSDRKNIVAFMRLFIDGGYTISFDDADYRDRVLKLGEEAEKNVLAFLELHGSKVQAAGTVLKSARKLHRAGLLNDRIVKYQALFAAGKVLDPTPTSTKNILKPIALACSN